MPTQRFSESKRLLNVTSTLTSTLVPTQLSEQAVAQQKKAALGPENSTNKNTVEEPENLVAVPQDEQAADESQRQASSEVSTQREPQIQQDQTNASLKSQWNNDQFFFNLLSNQNLLVNLLVFLGLGILLAFLPCSLPLIPILSGILVQRKTGYRAAFIAEPLFWGWPSCMP